MIGLLESLRDAAEGLTRVPRLLLSALNALPPLPWRIPTGIVGKIGAQSRSADGELFFLRPGENHPAIKILAEIFIPPLIWFKQPGRWKARRAGPAWTPSGLLEKFADFAFMGDTRVDPPTPRHAKAAPRERWFFVNGIATPFELGRINRRVLEDQLQRPVTLVHNPTDSIYLDLLECVLAKSVGRNDQPGAVLAFYLAQALADPNVERVVVIGHSQGTLVTRHAVRILQRTKPTRSQVVLDPTAIDPTAELDLHQSIADFFALRPFARRVDLSKAYPGALPPGVDRTSFDLNRAVYRDLDLSKLDVCLYANCTSVMDSRSRAEADTDARVPGSVINISNTNDIVGRLGIASHLGWLSRYFGFTAAAELDDGVHLTSADGHLLGFNYLIPRPAELREALLDGPHRRRSALEKN